MDAKETARERKQPYMAVLFPAVIFYYEIFLRLFTVGGIFRGETLLLVPFCCAYGALGYILTTIFKNRRTNYYITAALLFLTAVPYGVEVFVFQAFKIFYDINTVFNGAGDMVGDFMGEVLRLLFSFGGLFRLAIYILPTALYLLRGTAPTRITGQKRGYVAVRAVAFYVICVLIIQMAPRLSRLYGNEYNFQMAVDEFGLMTGLELNVQANMTGGGGGSFTREETIQMPDAEENAEQPEEGEGEQTRIPAADPAVYGVNQLDLHLNDPDAGSQIRALNEYVASQTASSKNAFTGRFAGKNLIMITAEAFTAEVIDPELTPTLYRLATKGIQFTDYYQPSGAGTTGGEYQHIFGLLPSNGGTSFTSMVKQLRIPTMANLLAVRGYYGKAFHNNTYTYYDRDKTHTKLGYSDGYMGYGNGMEEYVTKQWPESDYEMFAGTFPTYADNQPFNVYYMTVSGHGTYPFAVNAMARKHRDQVEDLPYSEPVQGYLAANLDLEDAMAYLVGELEARGMADNTVICITADHFPYGLDENGTLGNMPYLSELYGYNVEDHFQRDHNRWILWCGELEKSDPIVVDEPTFTLDILPTLSNLFGVDFDSRILPGRDVFSDAPALVFDSTYSWKTAYGTYDNSTGEFVPADDSVEVPANYVSSMRDIVANKIRYCSSVLNNGYFTYLFWG